MKTSILMNVDDLFLTVSERIVCFLYLQKNDYFDFLREYKQR